MGISTTGGAEKQMVGGKIILVVALYIILGVIAFFNFGFYHRISDNVRSKVTVNDTAGKDVGGTVADTQSEVSQESQGLQSDEEVNK